MVNQELYIDKKLPQLIIPSDKINKFIEWYNTDLIYEMHIPEVFNRGYLKLDLTDVITYTMPSIFETKDATEYQAYKTLYNTFIQMYTRVTIYFELNEKNLDVFIYDVNKKLMYKASIDLTLRNMYIAVVSGSIKDTKDMIKPQKLVDNLGIPHLKIDLSKIMREAVSSGRDVNAVQQVMSDNIGTMFRQLALGMIVSSFWYLTTIKPKSKTELVYNSMPHKHSKSKLHRYNYMQNITAPIYNLKYADDIVTEKLATKHNSWKISCAFPVRGHYRHYKNGKVIFIKSYEKGKGNAIKTARLNLNPTT